MRDHSLLPTQQFPCCYWCVGNKDLLEALHEGFEARNFILIPKDMSEARR